MEETEKISVFVLSTSFKDVPSNTINLAKRCMLDLIGVAIFATTTRWGRIAISFSVDHGSDGDSTVFGVSSKKFDPLSAALANGTCAHGFELDDVHYPSISHPGAVVIPAALALAETCDVSGATLLESIIAGYEVMGRIGSTISRCHIAKGFHPTGTFGVFGAASACVKILDLNLDEIQNAFGIAGSFASGIMQFSINGSMVKRIHAGNAAEQGMKAALLAKKGFTGPREILEGKYGFCRVFTDTPESVDWMKMTENLGEKYVIQEISVKPSAACGVLHSVVDCIKMINEERRLDENQIEEIIVSGHENLVHEHNVYIPNSMLAAQYSLPFTVGLTVMGKIDNSNTYLEESILRNDRVLEIGRKVNTKLDEEIQKIFPDKFGAKVSIKFKDGELITKTVLDPKGSTNNPLSQDEIERKFRAVAEDSLGEERATILIDRINSIESMQSVRALFKYIY